jgi:hypothetical protein
MKKLLRTVQLDDEQYSQIVGVLEADNPRSIATVLKHLMQQLAKDKARTWSEMGRLAGANMEKEIIELSHLTKQIVVYERSESDNMLDDVYGE